MLTGSFDVEFTDVTDVLENFEDNIIKPMTAFEHMMYEGRCSIQLTKWHDIGDNTYLALELLLNINNANDYTLRVIEGYQDESTIHHGDAFVDIKTDKEHIETAIGDILNGTIPLYNRVESIDTTKYTYVVEDTDDDE